MNINKVFILSALGVITASVAYAAPQNLLKNGDFEIVENGVAKDWKITDKPDLVEKRFPIEESQGRVAQIELRKWDPSGAYLSQSVKVRPDTNYRLSFKGRMNMGNMRITISGGKDDGKVSIVEYGRAAHHSMFPFFWREEWSKYLIFSPDKWRPVIIDFNSGNASSIHISMGAYQRVGTYSFDDVSLTEISKKK